MHALWNLSKPMIRDFAVTHPCLCKRKTAEVVAGEMLKDDRVSRRSEIRTVGYYSPGRGKRDVLSSECPARMAELIMLSQELHDRQVVLSLDTLSLMRPLRQAIASKLTLQRFSVYAKDFSGPGEIMMVGFKYAYNIVPFKILQRDPAGNLGSI